MIDYKPDTLPFAVNKKYEIAGKEILLKRPPLPDFNSIKKQFAPINSLFQNPIVFTSGEVNYNRLNNASSLVPGMQTTYDNLEINSSWSFMGIPFTIQLDNQQWIDQLQNNLLNYSLQFDRENYLDQLKKKVKGNFNPRDFINNTINNQVEKIKNQAEVQLKKELNNINENYGNILNERIGELGNVNELFTKDMLSLKNKLLSIDYIKSIEDKAKLLAEMINRRNTGKPVNKEEIKQLEKEIKQLKGTTDLLSKVEEHKSKWQSSGLLKKIKQLDLLNKKKLEQFINDPATTIKLAKQQLNLNSIQKLFLKINKLNLGQNTLSASPLSVSHLLNNGFNTELLNNNKYLFAGLGKLKTSNSILDQVFTDNLNANEGLAKMISIGKGSNTSSHAHISVMSYDQTFNRFPGFSQPENFRNTVVTTISNQVTIGERGFITAEISRSATSYQNVAVSDSALQDKSSLQRILSGDNLFNNMAFAVRYEDEIVDKGFSYGVHINKTSQGYTNPGNTFLNAGGKEMGFKLRKSFWKRKLQASVRSEIREYDYSNDGDKKWRNFYTVLDIRLRMKKGQTIGLRYIPNKMKRVENGIKQTVTSMERLSVDGNIGKRIAGTYYRNNFTLAWQKNNYVWDNQVMINNTLTLSSFQSVVIKRKLVYLNTSYDYAANNTQFVYFNSTLLAEAGTTYQLFKKINLSSAVSYNSVAGWYRQLGVKQTISGEINDRFNLDVHIDARKNLKLYQPLLYGLFRADISIHYLIGR